MVDPAVQARETAVMALNLVDGGNMPEGVYIEYADAVLDAVVPLVEARVRRDIARQIEKVPTHDVPYAVPAAGHDYPPSTRVLHPRDVMAALGAALGG